MWKKTSIIVALGLMWVPGSTMAATFDGAFAGIVNGIAQGLAAEGTLESDSNYDTQGTVIAGNVVIGSALPEMQQVATVDGVSFDNAAGTGVTQAVNYTKGEVSVLAMQGVNITGNVRMVSNSTKGGSIQGINVITACSGVNCE